MKNFFIGVLLICIVVGSFWTSFLIGKKVLVPPIKNFPSLETPAPRAISKLDLEKATSVNEETAIKETEVKQAPIKAVLPRTVSPKKLMAAKQVSSGESEKVATMKQIVRIPVAKMKGPKFYKVIVGTFRTAGEANSFVKTLKTKGFPSYVKEIAGFYRVQAGAYDIREKTKPLVAKLKRKGITPSIILE